MERAAYMGGDDTKSDGTDVLDHVLDSGVLSHENLFIKSTGINNRYGN